MLIAAINNFLVISKSEEKNLNWVERKVKRLNPLARVLKSYFLAVNPINKLIVYQRLYNKINSNHNNELNQIFVHCPRADLSSRVRDRISLLFFLSLKNLQSEGKTLFFMCSPKRACNKLFINVLIE